MKEFGTPLNEHELKQIRLLYVSSHEIVYSNLNQKFYDFKIKHLLTPKNLYKDLFEKEIEETQKRICQSNEIFRDYIEGYLLDARDVKSNDDGSSYLIEEFMKHFAINEFFDDYVNFDYSTIDMFSDEEDIKLPLFKEMIQLLSFLGYHKELCFQYNNMIKKGFDQHILTHIAAKRAEKC